MNIGILIGKHNSGGVAGKNYMTLLGRPVVEYPLLAAKNSNVIDELYISTDSETIKDINQPYGFNIIDRPDYLCQSDSPTEDVFKHAYDIIKKNHRNINYIILLFANSVDVLPADWDEAVKMLDNNQEFDSVVSISKFNMFSPLRARLLDKDNSTKPLLNIESMGLENTFDRDALGDCYFIDFSIQVIRPKCLENIDNGSLPFKWLGQTQGAITKDYGFDIDAEWQIPVMENWLKVNGFSETKVPY